MANEIKQTKNKGEYIECCGSDLEGINQMIITSLKKNGGRPAVFPNTKQGLEDFRQQTLKFFEHIAEINTRNGLERGVIPDVELWCGYMGITRTTLFTYQNTRGEDWKTTIETIKNYIAAYKKQMALTYKVPPMIAVFDLVNNHSYHNTNEVKLTAETITTPEQAEHQKLEQAIQDNALRWSEELQDFVKE
jgi:hypothetical protein